MINNSNVQTVHEPLAATVLSKAVIRVADQFGLTRLLLSQVLGLSPATITRLCHGKYQLEQKRKEWEFALLLVRIFRSLDSIVNNQNTARAWLHSPNKSLNARPIDLMTDIEGLVRVVQYLDASRGII